MPWRGGGPKWESEGESVIWLGHLTVHIPQNVTKLPDTWQMSDHRDLPKSRHIARVWGRWGEG